MSIKAIIDVAWQDRHQAWEGFVQLQHGHACNCPHCGRTGLKVEGVVSTGRNKREAFELACQNLQGFLSMIQGVPMALVTYPGSNEVEFAEDPAAAEEEYEEEEIEDEEFEYSR